MQALKAGADGGRCPSRGPFGRRDALTSAFPRRKVCGLLADGLRDLGLAEQDAQASLLETEWPRWVPQADWFQAAARPLVQRVTQASAGGTRGGCPGAVWI